MKPKLCLETTVPSYLVSRSSRDLIIAGHQQITKEWWDRRRKGFDIYISQFVVDEARGGDSHAARDRMKAIHGLPLDVELRALSEREHCQGCGRHLQTAWP